MPNDEDEEEEILQLPADTLNALQDFYSESDARRKEFEDLKESIETESNENVISIDAFTEDWNASQFWYNDETAIKLANALLKDSTNDTWIAVVSAPSVFVQIKKLLVSRKSTAIPYVRLFEYDERFGVFKEFVRYDFSEPFRLPVELKGRFSRIICDPPFLSQECQTKVAMTARWLADPTIQPSHRPQIVCTGAVMESLIVKLYAKERVKTTNFHPKHAKGLSNEFCCFTNFEGDDWQWVE